MKLSGGIGIISRDFHVADGAQIVVGRRKPPFCDLLLELSRFETFDFREVCIRSTHHWPLVFVVTVTAELLDDSSVQSLH